MLKNKKVLLAVLFFCIIILSTLLILRAVLKTDAEIDSVVLNSPAPGNPASSTEPTPTPEPTPDLTGKEISKFTGEYIDEEIAKLRPYAVVINNMHVAKPQSGISQADLYYEVLSEGDITRIVAIFQGGDSEKIGPVRSARHYFLDFALDNDAAFFHYGQSPQAEKALKSLAINNLNGIYDSKTYWRDPKRSSIPKMLEHSAYTDSPKMAEGVERMGYRQEIKDDYEPMFDFYKEETVPDNSEKADKINVNYSGSYYSDFEFDSETGLYKKFDAGEPHMDDENNTQLTVSNVIIQTAKMNVISGDEAGRRDVDLISSGKGYLITKGVYTPISWKKSSHQSPTQWFDSEGNKLKLNTGKTWICVFSGEPKFTDSTAAESEEE